MTAGTTPGPENTRTRLAVELSSSAALAVFVSPGQPGRTAANTYDFASVPPVAGDDPVNGTDADGMGGWPPGFCAFGAESDPAIALACLLFPNGPPGGPGSGPITSQERNGGAIQAQGPDIKGNGSTRSVSWSGYTIPAAMADGQRWINDLKDQLTGRQLKVRKAAFEDLTNYVTSVCPANNGCQAPVSKSWHDPGQPSNVRVDLEIQSGKAFIPDNYGSEAAYLTICSSTGGVYV